MADLPLPRRNSGFKFLLSLACLFIVIGGLKMASELLLPILLGFFLAVLSLPLMNWLKARRVPAAVAVLSAVAVDVLALTGLVFLTASVMPDFQASAAKYDEKFREMLIVSVEDLDTWFEETVAPVQTWFSDIFGDPNVEEEQPPLFDLKGAVEEVLSMNSLMSLVNWVNQVNILQRLISLLTKTFFAFVLMIFILAEAERFASKIEQMVQARGPDFNRFRHAGQQVQRYLWIKTLASIATGVLAWLTCRIVGVEFAVLWGLVAFLFNYVPTIGSLVAAIPAILVALLQLGFLESAIVAACYLGINVGIGNFAEPAVMGRGFGISTVVVILSVLFWGWLWGPVGMFLAVPLTMVIKMMVDSSDDLHWISIAISKNRDAELEALIDGGPPEEEGLPVDRANESARA